MYRCHRNICFVFSSAQFCSSVFYSRLKLLCWIWCFCCFLLILYKPFSCYQIRRVDSPWGRLLSAPGVYWSEVEGVRCRPTFPVYRDCRTSPHPDGTPAPDSLIHCTPGHTQSWWHYDSTTAPCLDTGKHKNVRMRVRCTCSEVL